MTLEQLAFVGQIIAAVAVVASLLYVARQLGQNTAMMRANASGQRVQRDADLSFRMSDNQEFTELWLAGGRDLESLDEAGRTRLVFFSRIAIVHWHNMFQLREQNLLPDADWNEMIWVIRFVGAREDTRAAWTMFRDAFDKAFQDFLDRHLAAAGAGS
jgi:hypothetical protein